MRLFRKENDTVQVLCFPDEEVKIGDYLVIEDRKSDRSLIVQVIDTQFANLPGIMEDLLRDCMNDTNLFGDDYDPLHLDSQITLIRDARLLLGKIRCSVEHGTVSMNFSWLPSRTSSTVYRLKPEKLLELLNIGRMKPIKVGETESGSDLLIDADALDGKLSIITGRKGTGKSHLSKLLLLGLVDHGAPCVIFDVNGEYMWLNRSSDGGGNSYQDKILVLEPCRDFKVTLSYAGLGIISNIMAYTLGLPEASLREFHGVWRDLERKAIVCIKTLKGALQTYDLNEHVREALLSRLHTLTRSGFFTDEEKELVRIEDVYDRVSGGGAIVLNLCKVSSVERRIVVEFMLGKLVELLKQWRLKAIFLFAEEAHLYIRETYWEDIVTMMRHLGLFTIFITNQPDSIHEDIYRQADSIFLFNFRNEHDLNAISKVAKIDNETMKSIAQSLEPHHCLTIGHATKEIPFVVKVKPLNVKTMGETRKFFN